jgi:hypothetical protein
LIEQADYIALATDDPALCPEEAAQPSPDPGQEEFKLEAVASFEYPGGEGQIEFRAGERVQLLNAFPDDWLEGQVRGNIGYLPASYVDVVPYNGPVPGMTMAAAQQQQSQSLPAVNSGLTPRSQ